jgi:CRISPR system Cascade subunit CasB
MSLAIKGVVDWWRELQPDHAHNRAGDRAALARLRRCTTVAEAMQDPAAIALYRRCGGSDPRDLPTVGLAAGVLAHVRADDPHQLRVARSLGPKTGEGGETALLKPLRFRRLMEAETLDERLTAFRRMVALANGALNVSDLAGALVNWSEARRMRWIYDYWNAGQPTAASEETTP